MSAGMILLTILTPGLIAAPIADVRYRRKSPVQHPETGMNPMELACFWTGILAAAALTTYWGYFLATGVTP